MAQYSINRFIHKLGHDQTASSQQMMLVIQPQRKGIALARPTSVQYDKLYDIYELHELGAVNLKNKQYHAPITHIQKNTVFQTHEKDCSQSIACQICLHFSKRSKRVPIFNKGSQNYSASGQKMAIISPQNLVLERQALEQQSSIYYTCRSDYSQT